MSNFVVKEGFNLNYKEEENESKPELTDQSIDLDESPSKVRLVSEESGETLRPSLEGTEEVLIVDDEPINLIALKGMCDNF